MTEISFFTGELLLAVAWLLARVCVWIVRRSIDWKREAQLLVMLVNLGVIVRFVFFPMRLVEGKIAPLLFDPDRVTPFWINLTPLAHLFDFASTREALLNLLGNIAMFIPSGIVIPILYKSRDSFWKVLVSGSAISLCIEILQLPFFGRASDIDDLLLNTTGVAIGYGVYAFVRFLNNRRRRKSK